MRPQFALIYHQYSIVGYGVTGNASRGVPVIIQPSILLLRPKAGAVVHAPPRLVWAKIRRATGPAFGPRSRSHYGNLLGQSGFRDG